MDRFRADVAGEKKSFLFLDSIRIKSAYSKYEHRELAGNEIGTIFRNRGIETRVDGKKGDLLIGLQQQYFKFSAFGEEAFLPTTENSSFAFFGFHEWALGRVKPALGLRLDSLEVKSLSDVVFGSGNNKTYFAPSSSLGFQIFLNQPATEETAWILGLNSTYTERAPNYQELFANGEHVATGIFEKGDSNFKTEKNLGFELSLKSKSDLHEARMSGFYQGFQNYIALSPTGTSNAGEDGVPGNADDIPIFNYQAVKAQLFGAELEYLYRFPTPIAGGVLETEFKWDWLRGLDSSHNGNLPRMTPMRSSLGLHFKHSLFSAEVEYQRVEGQSLLAQNETSTLGYQLMNVTAEFPLKIDQEQFKLIFQINNLFNVAARNHISFLKDEVPLPGRNFVLGLKAQL
jgi:iron complex outermembrane receptor protein